MVLHVGLRTLRRIGPNAEGALAVRRNIRLSAIVTALLLLLGACSGGDGLGSTPASEPSAPSGDGVGVHTERLVDGSRGTKASKGQRATDERVLDTVIWYPTRGSEDGVEEDAEPATDRGPFPLIVFSHGFGGSPDNIRDVADDWVRAGFVVAAPNFPLSRTDHRGGPDATDVENQPADVSFVITALTEELDDDSPLAGLVDGDRIGVAGHSLGAITTLAAAANTCCADDRIDAVVEMAGTIVAFSDGEYDFSSMPPLLVVHGTDDELVDYRDASEVWERAQPPRGLLTIDGGTHDSWFEPGGDGHDEIARVTTDFFLAYLTGDTDAVDRLSSEQTEDPAAELRFEAAGDRTATAAPTTGLVAGQQVTVAWSGFTPGGTVSVLQCSRGGAADGADCARATGHLMKDDPRGSGTLRLAIVVGAVGDGRCDASVTSCVILVNDSGLTDPDATVRIPLTFAP
jgi:dienelactone hydrolase